MFYYVAKIFWSVASISNFIGLGLSVALIALLSGYARLAKRLLVFLTVLYLACGFGPVGAALLRPLEDRFPMPSEPLAAPDGVIVLGGGVDDGVTAARNTVTFNQPGARLTTGAALSRRFPQAELVYSGGSDKLPGPFGTEEDAVRALFKSLGVDMERTVFENRSRDTYENAIFTRELIHPKPGSRWLLVTSAFHMPRSIAIFRKAGFDVIAYPADYQTLGDARDFYLPVQEATRGLQATALGVHEWIGLVAYRLAGRTDAVFPAPEAETKTTGR